MPIKVRVSTRKKNRASKIGPYQKAVHKEMKKLWKQGTGQFVEAVVNNVEVDTGMSAASLLPLAAQAGKKKVISSLLRGTRGPRKGFTDMDGNWNPAGFKSKAQGERAGRGAFIFDLSNETEQKYIMEFNIPVFQFALHEEGIPQHTTGPWNSLEAGREAFLNHVTQNAIRKIPNVATYLNGKKIKQGQ